MKLFLGPLNPEFAKTVTGAKLPPLALEISEFTEAEAVEAITAVSMGKFIMGIDLQTAQNLIEGLKTCIEQVTAIETNGEVAN